MTNIEKKKDYNRFTLEIDNAKKYVEEECGGKNCINYNVEQNSYNCIHYECF